MKLSDIQDEDFLNKQFEQKSLARQRSYWYLSGSAPNKAGIQKPFLLGPYSSSDKAEEIATRKRLTDALPILIPTSDLGKAGQILRARRLHGNSSFAEIFEKMKHKHVGADNI